jgi:rubrerythrin
MDYGRPKKMTSPSQCSTEMLATALEMEEKGKVFYKKAVNSCQNPQCKEIFTALAEEEVVHSRRIKQIYDTLTSGQCWSRDWESIKGSPKDFGVLFQNLAAKEKTKIKAETSDLEAVDIGLDFESVSVQFYQDHRVKATDPIEAAFLDQMIREEGEHLKALKDTRYYLTDPEGWFMEKEHAGLDGG